ncbi:MAG: succinate dehydrogenase assembly factor 2 [Gammaproteobacteria bacterium]|jgi:antitoxin CptB
MTAIERNFDSSNAELSRLKWRCRRGMRELDVLLERFLERQYSVASSEIQLAFARLLSLPDPEIFALILGRQITENPELRDVIQRLRHSF